jgi:hypothetical protein
MNYPVDPTYASGGFHLHVDLTDDLELLMKTYANGAFVSKKLHHKIGIQYTRKVDAYLSKVNNQPRAADFISFDEFCRGLSIPSASAIRALYVSAYHSPLTTYGYSQYERNVREMQNVDVRKGDAIALDWTFQAVKNYKLPGAKAIFTANNGRTNEILTLGLVSSTSVSQVSHMLVEMLHKRRSFKPTYLYHDTCPNLQDFFSKVFGVDCCQRLGLFHLLHRITDTLNNKSEKYWEALCKLKASIYDVNKEDEAQLLTSLQDGSFSQSGKKYTITEIKEIRHSKAWKERFGAFLRKRILPGPTIAYGLSEWVETYKNVKDDEGKYVFTQTTEKVCEEQKKKSNGPRIHQSFRLTKKSHLDQEAPINFRNGHRIAQNLALKSSMSA